MNQYKSRKKKIYKEWDMWCFQKLIYEWWSKYKIYIDTFRNIKWICSKYKYLLLHIKYHDKSVSSIILKLIILKYINI